MSSSAPSKDDKPTENPDRESAPPSAAADEDDDLYRISPEREFGPPGSAPQAAAQGDGQGTQQPSAPTATAGPEPSQNPSAAPAQPYNVAVETLSLLVTDREEDVAAAREHFFTTPMPIRTSTEQGGQGTQAPQAEPAKKKVTLKLKSSAAKATAAADDEDESPVSPKSKPKDKGKGKATKESSKRKRNSVPSEPDDDEPSDEDSEDDNDDDNDDNYSNSGKKAAATKGKKTAAKPTSATPSIPVAPAAPAAPVTAGPANPPTGTPFPGIPGWTLNVPTLNDLMPFYRGLPNATLEPPKPREVPNARLTPDSDTKRPFNIGEEAWQRLIMVLFDKRDNKRKAYYYQKVPDWNSARGAGGVRDLNKWRNQVRNRCDRSENKIRESVTPFTQAERDLIQTLFTGQKLKGTALANTFNAQRDQSRPERTESALSTEGRREARRRRKAAEQPKAGSQPKKQKTSKGKDAGDDDDEDEDDEDDDDAMEE